MLDHRTPQGFLANGTAIPTFAHKPQHVAAYLAACQATFAEIKGWLDAAGGDGFVLAAELSGPVAG